MNLSLIHRAQLISLAPHKRCRSGRIQLVAKLGIPSIRVIMRILLVVILVVCLGEAQLQLPGRVMTSLKNEVAYESVLVLHSPNISCGIGTDSYSGTPILNFNFNQSYVLKQQFNSRLLAVVCVDDVRYPTLSALHRNLNEIRDTPVIILSGPRTDLYSLFRYCFNNKMLNVLAFDSTDPDYIYSYRAFPNLLLSKKRISQVREFFEPQLRNLGGFPIRSLPDNTLPRSVLYFDAEGTPKLTGYLVEFLRNFAKTLNTSLHICWSHMPLHQPDNILSWNTVSRLAQKDIVDIPLCMINIGGMIYSSLRYSHVLEISKYQLMLPVEDEINRNLLIFRASAPLHFILTFCVLWLFVLLLYNTRRRKRNRYPNLWDLPKYIDPVLRAMLLQPFVMPQRLSRLTMRVFCLLLTFSFLSYNVYIAQLEMLMVHPPTEPMVRTYKDLQNAGLKVLVTDNEVEQMKRILDDDVLDHFWDYHEEVNSSEYQAKRRQPNSSYAYPITHTLWPLIERKLIKQPAPLFRLSDDFIFYSMVPFAVPLPSNSIFKEALNQYILQTQCSGLYNLWFQQSFSCLLAIGKMDVLPYDGGKENMHLQWDDLFYVWYLYALCLGLCCFVFALELVYHRVGKSLK